MRTAIVTTLLAVFTGADTSRAAEPFDAKHAQAFFDTLNSTQQSLADAGYAFGKLVGESLNGKESAADDAKEKAKDVTRTFAAVNAIIESMVAPTNPSARKLYFEFIRYVAVQEAAYNAHFTDVVATITDKNLDLEAKKTRVRQSIDQILKIEKARDESWKKMRAGFKEEFKLQETTKPM